MVQSSNPDPERAPGRDRPMWYRSSAAVTIAGLVGTALIVALVVTVVRMSDQWSSPTAPTVMTSDVPTTQQTLRTTAPFIATPSSATSSFPTSADLSTTDIGIPGEAVTTTASSETSPGESRPTTRRPPRTQDEDDDETTTTRKRPRLNETRTLSP